MVTPTISPIGMTLPPVVFDNMESNSVVIAVGSCVDSSDDKSDLVVVIKGLVAVVVDID